MRITTLVLILISIKISTQILPDWENPEITGVNKEPTQATFTCDKKIEDAFTFTTPSTEKSLNGSWKLYILLQKNKVK